MTSHQAFVRKWPKILCFGTQLYYMVFEWPKELNTSFYILYVVILTGNCVHRNAPLKSSVVQDSRLYLSCALLLKLYQVRSIHMLNGQS